MESASQPTCSLRSASSALNYARFDLWAKLRLQGFRCATLVHPRAFVDPSAMLADNVLVGPGAIIEPDANIGARNDRQAGAQRSARRRNVGPWCWVARRVVVGTGATVGAHVCSESGVHLADHTEFPGPGEIDVAGTYRGKFTAGTFVAPEFPVPGARLVRHA